MLLGHVLELLTDASLTFHGCEIPHFGYNGAIFCVLTMSSFLQSYESRLPFIPVIITRIIRAFPLPRHYCGISVADLSPALSVAVCLQHTLHRARIPKVYAISLV